jgi:hypothetical protein
MQPSFFLDHVASYAASSCGAPPSAALYTALPQAGHGAVPYGMSSYGAPPGAAPYAALLHAGYVAPNAAPTHAGRVVPHSASSYGAPPSAAAAVPYAGYAASYAAPLHAGYAARNASPTYAGYVAPNAALPHVGHTAFYVAPPASAQIWAPSSSTEWVFDSSATAHLSKDAGILHSLSLHPVYRHVTVGDGSSVPVSSSGHASIPSFLSNHPLHLCDVLVTPRIIKNLVSVR